jgi:hypothetical protein
LHIAVDRIATTSDTTIMATSTLNNEIRRRVQQAAELASEERILCGIKQSELAIRLVEDGLRHKHPGADEATIASFLLEWIRLMKRVQNRKLSDV